MRSNPQRAALALSCIAALALQGCDDASSKANSPRSVSDAVGTGGLVDSPVFAKEVAAQNALNQGRAADALRFLDELLVLEPNSTSAAVNRAVALNMLGRNEEALAATAAAAKLAPTDPENQINRAQILWDLKRYDEALLAVDVVQPMIDTSNEFVPQKKAELGYKWRALKGRVLVAMGRGTETLPVLDELERILPGSPLVVLERIHCYDRIGRRAEADALMAALMQRFPNDPGLQAAIAARPSGN
jgi:tetratricopeptide (TPR) repeat protein